MCGILGFSGTGDVRSIVATGLSALQYRGYDACGCALWQAGRLDVAKCVGPRSLDELISSLPAGLSHCRLVCHTRWATHGANSEVNTHPHLDCTGTVAVVHNGVIENYTSLRRLLVGRGHRLVSDTDTEVIPHLIEEYLKDRSFAGAVRKALIECEGRFAVALLSAAGVLAAARRGLPLAVGIQHSDLYLASDLAALPDAVSLQIPLDDGQLFLLEGDVPSVLDLCTGRRLPVRKIPAKRTGRQTTLGGYPHYMLKEIHEQPEAVGRTVAAFSKDAGLEMGRLLARRRVGRLIVTACGTSWHAGLIGKYMIEEEARLPVEVDYASEFRYRNPPLEREDVVVAVSQSGETADTLAAVELARERGCTVASICNVPDSTLCEMSDLCLHTAAGPEVGVASTKAFTAQIAVMRLLSLSVSLQRGTINPVQYAQAMEALLAVPSLMAQVCGDDGPVRDLANRLVGASSMLYLGRGIQFPVALEGALKVKEVAYIHAEGYPAAEMKHGPIALVEKDTPVLCIAVADRTYHKALANAAEVSSRGATVILVSNHPDAGREVGAAAVFRVPGTADHLLMPFLTVIPLQLFAYHAALARGCEVDRPRNLAKSVTVE